MNFSNCKKVLLKCNCCFDEKLRPEECLLCKKGCTFCRSCVKLGAESRISDGFIDFPCLTNCDSEFTMATLQMVLEPAVFGRLNQRKFNEFTEKCPFCSCVTVTQIDSRTLKCLNPNCLKESCRFCRCISHKPLQCHETESDEEVKTRTYIENKMTEAIVRKCSSCKRAYIKVSGCNSVTCICGAKNCYKIYCDNPNNAVIMAAQAAKVELGVDVNPEKLKIDPTIIIDRFFK